LRISCIGGRNGELFAAFIAAARAEVRCTRKLGIASTHNQRPRFTRMFKAFAQADFVEGRPAFGPLRSALDAFTKNAVTTESLKYEHRRTCATDKIDSADAIGSAFVYCEKESPLFIWHPYNTFIRTYTHVCKQQTLLELTTTTAVYLSAMGDAAQLSTPNNRLFYDAFNASPIGIALENLDGQPLFVNSFLCSMLGFSEQEMRAKHCVEFSPPEDAKRDWALFEQLRTGLIDRYQIEKRFIRRDGSLVWGRLTISLLNQTPRLVMATVEDITKQRTAEEARGRDAAIVESSDDAIISKNLDGIIQSWNVGAQRIFGYTESEAVGQPIAILIPPDLWHEEEKFLEKLRAGIPIAPYETIRVTKAGKNVDVFLSIFVIKDLNGEIVGFTKIARDITARKQAEVALANVARSLIKAQEQERMRIGRELHDDIGQRLAMLTIQIEELQQIPFDSPDQVRSRIEALKTHASGIAADVQSLSHELHSAKLQYLGIAAAMKSFCQEFAQQQKVEIDFRASDLPNSLSPDISLGLFRVLQEALHNSLKHSGVRQFEVRLWGTSDETNLTVKDSGVGFDREVAMTSRGLGLTSMGERLKLLNGTLSIESQPHRGTTIHARVPLDSKCDSRCAGG